MANRRSTFLLKRSNIAGKIPAAGDLQLGELALNIADNILYASGTTANSILPIGWDRVARTGDTMTGGLFAPYLSATTISATTYLNLPTMSGSGLPLSGGTVSGDTTFISGITANTIYTNYIDFNTGYTGQTLPAGRLQWDDGNGTLILGLKGGTSNMEIGLENMALCFNDEATTLTAGTVVYVSGSQGNRPSIKRAIATSDGYSVTTLGIVSESIASGAEGFVTTFGMVNNLNTIGYSGGTAIWLSPTVSGAFTSVKPQAPQHTVLLGYVVRVHDSVGSIFVHISNGWEIDELHDVRFNNKVEGDLLAYSAYNGSNVWVNTKTLNGSYTITGNTNIGGGLTASTVSASTISGNNLYVTGGTQSIFSGNSSSDLVRITQTGTGNAFVVEDSNNPDSSSFVIDTNGNVGLGTITPSTKLHVSGNTIFGIGNDTSNYATTIICSNDGINPKGLFVTRGANLQGLHIHNLDGSQVNIDAIGFAAKPLNIRNRMAESLIFGTNDTERMRITSAGDVGLGITNPTAKLHINNVGTGNSFLVEDETNPDTTPFIIDATGSVGIGTTTPTSKLHLYNTGTNILLIERSSSFNAPIQYTNSIGSMYAGLSAAAANFAIGTTADLSSESDAKLTVVRTTGNVGIGTTAPTAKLEVSGNTIINGTLTATTISATTISATTYQNLPIDIRVTGGTYSNGTATFTNNTGGTFTVTGYNTGTTVGNGTNTYLARWTGSTGLSNSVIRDNGSTVGLNVAPASDAMFTVNALTDQDYAFKMSNVGTFLSTVNSNGFLCTVSSPYQAIGGSISATSGDFYDSFGLTVSSTAVLGQTSTGIIASASGGGTNYAIQLQDGTQAVNRVLVSKTNDGKANWSSTLSGLTSVQTNALTVNGNIIVTGGTQSIFSGNSSSGLVRITQTGSGNALVVEDANNPDASSFVINASGDTAIGLLAPLNGDKLTVSGNTTIYGTLSATTYAGLPNSGVLVVPIATSSVAIGTGSNDYYLNFKIPYNLTISKVDFSVSTAGSDSVRIGIYRGQDLTAVLVGQSAGGTVSTLNSVPIVAEVGQNLTFSAGSWIVIGVAVGGTTTNLYGSACPANNLIAWTNTTDSSGGFPANPRSKAGTRTSFPSIEITVA